MKTRNYFSNIRVHSFKIIKVKTGHLKPSTVRYIRLRFSELISLKSMLILSYLLTPPLLPIENFQRDFSLKFCMPSGVHCHSKLLGYNIMWTSRFLFYFFDIWIRGYMEVTHCTYLYILPKIVVQLSTFCCSNILPTFCLLFSTS